MKMQDEIRSNAAFGSFSQKADAEINTNFSIGNVIRIKAYARRIRKKLEYKRASKQIILPNSRAKMSWDFLNFVLLIYSVFEVPYALSFLPATCDLSLHEDINLLIDCTFLFDIIINFFTAYLDENVGILEVRLLAIAKHYTHGWLFFDILSSLPVDRIVCFAVNHSNSEIRFLKAARVIKVFRIARMLRLAVHLEESIGTIASKTIHLLKFLGILLLCAHLCACAWHVVIEINGCSIPADESPGGPVTCGCAEGECRDYNWLVRYDAGIYDGDSPGARYLVSVYYAVVTLTTLGYGDVVPTNQVRPRPLHVLLSRFPEEMRFLESAAGPRSRPAAGNDQGGGRSL